MTFLEIQTDFAGQIGYRPRRPKIRTDATLSEVLTAGFLNSPQALGYTFYPDDMIDISYGDNVSQTFTIASISSGVITLQQTSADIALPVTANHIAVFTDTSGTLGDDPAIAMNGGDLQAGLNAVAGKLRSYSSTTASGSLEVFATANTGDTLTQLTNAAMAQASTVVIPDPGSAQANVLLKRSTDTFIAGDFVQVRTAGTAGLLTGAGGRIIANTTAAYGGGGTSNAFAATGLTVNAKGTAVIRASTNSVAITKALPGTDTLTITFSADPGAATTVDYIYFTAAHA